MCSNSRIITYELINSICQSDGAEGALVYGIVLSQNTDSSDEMIILRDISVKKENVEQLIIILEKAQVTPNEFMYIVEDYIAEL